MSILKKKISKERSKGRDGATENSNHYDGTCLFSPALSYFQRKDTTLQRETLV